MTRASYSQQSWHHGVMKGCSERYHDDIRVLMGRSIQVFFLHFTLFISVVLFEAIRFTELKRHSVLNNNDL